MSSKMREIAAVETIKAANNKLNQLRDALRQIVPTCQKEKGCLQYELFEPTAGSGEFLILMKWETLEDLRNHEASEPIQEFIRKYDGILYDSFTQTEWLRIYP